MAVLFYVMWYTTFFVTVIYFLSGLDDLIFDFTYWISFPYNKWKEWKSPDISLDKLYSVPEQHIALLVACWNEPAIGQMLEYNLRELKYQNYDVFVGVYPNDAETIAIVKKIQDTNPNVHAVMSPQPGPTTKASNLNSMYKYALEHEKENGFEYEIFVLHDTEDVIDPISFRLYNYAIPKTDMVQLPVIPLEVPWRYATHWIYNDEFAEIHTKDMVARGKISGFIPSAGVGTGFSKKAMRFLASKNNGDPFALWSLAEDYSVGLKLKSSGLDTMFLSFWTSRVTDEKKTMKVLAATRSLRIQKYRLSVRQRTRWTLGIIFQEWYHNGWPGSFFVKYNLFHDRKGLITSLVNVLGYVIIAYWILYLFMGTYYPGPMSLEALAIFAVGFMINRIIQRSLAVYRIYGFVPALMSPYRTVYANFINAHSMIRAYLQFFLSYNPKLKKSIKWDKTDNYFPDEKNLEKFKWRLGDFLLSSRRISKEQLKTALTVQETTHEKLGSILVKQRAATPRDVLLAFARQSNFRLVDDGETKTLYLKDLEKLDDRTYLWLLQHSYLPIDLHNNRILILFKNPPTEKEREEVRIRVRPYQAQFALRDSSDFEMGKSVAQDPTHLSEDHFIKEATSLERAQGIRDE